jgi:hypothetical protein
MLKQFITAGCSFTAGGSLIEDAIQHPKTWSHFLLPKINPEFFYNLAMPGGGNGATGTNLIYLLETKKYIEPKNTLIGINITGLDRIDTMCAVDHPDANKHFSWNYDFGYSWITEGGFTSNMSPFYGALQKNTELEQIRISNALAIITCFCYLELHKFNYFFMIMDDLVIQDSPPWFLDFLNCRQQQWITFNDHNTMHSLVKEKNLLEEDKFHPSIGGHQLIADIVIEQLVDKQFINNYTIN